LVGPSSILLAMMASGKMAKALLSRLFTNRKDEKKASFKSLEQFLLKKSISNIY
jgi:16S rRNA C1402 (ribose-2'-O) methylase RsmI